MTRQVFRTAAVAAATLMFAADASAGWGSWGGSSGYSSYGSSGGSSGYASSGGSSGGSSGIVSRWHSASSGGSSGYASSGGSYGSSGGSSGGLISRWRARRASWHSSGGSSGGSSGYSHGSSGGSSGYSYSYGSSGGSSGHSYSHGSSGGSSGYSYSYGSSGGSSGYSYSGVTYGSHYAASPGATYSYAQSTISRPAVSATGTNDGVLAVSVPSDAKVYVNGKLTSTPGAFRQYVSRNLEQGKNYEYEVRATATVDGQLVERVKSVTLRAGSTEQLSFDFASAPMLTKLTVHVPEDAKVYLSGNPTKATGTERVFQTSRLQPGDAWADYVVRVERTVEGKSVVEEKRISLAAGEQKSLDFLSGDSAAQLANAR